MLKKRLILLFLIISTLLTGCFNYRDINRVIFSTMLVIDVDEDDNIVIYSECFHSFRSTLDNTEQGQRLVYKATGKTLFDAVRELNTFSRYKIDYSQCKVYIFTERAAKQGLGDLIDFLRRDQEFLLRAFIGVFLGTGEELVKHVPKQDDFVGLLLEQMLQSDFLSTIIVNYRFNEFLNTRNIGKHVNKINAMYIDSTGPENFIKVHGVAIIQDDIMVYKLDPQETVWCNILYDQGRLKSGAIIVKHTDYEDKYVSLEIRKSKTTTNLHFDGRRINLIKKINIDVVIADVQDGLEWSEETLEKLEHLAEVKIKDETEALFGKLKAKGVDVLDIQHQVEMEYPGSDIENAIKISNLTSDINVQILGSSNIRGSN